MMSFISCLLTLLLITGHLTELTDTRVIHFDCGMSERLCPSLGNITLTCSITGGYLQWFISDGSTTIDISNSYSIGAEETSGYFTGTLISNSNSMTVSTLTFDSNLIQLGTIIKCRDNQKGGEEKCQLKANEIPSAPANLSYNDNTGSLSWSPSNTTIDYYSVTIITSSSIINYTTNETALELSTSLGEYYNNVSAYVRAIACQGQLTGMAASLILNSIPFPSLSVSFPSPSSTIQTTQYIQTLLESTFVTTPLHSASITTNIVTSSTLQDITRISSSKTYIMTATHVSSTMINTSTAGASTAGSRTVTSDTRVVTTGSVLETNDLDDNLIVIGIASGAVGCFLALLLIVLIAILFMCFYRLFCYKRANQSFSHPHSHSHQHSPSSPSPHFYTTNSPTPHCVSTSCNTWNRTVSTVSVVRNVKDDDDDIRVVPNPCFKPELLLSDDSDYPIPVFIRSLDHGGFSNEEPI